MSYSQEQLKQSKIENRGQIYMKFSTVLNECPTDLSRCLKDIYALSRDHLDEKQIVSVTSQMLQLLADTTQQDYNNDISKILLTTTTAIIPALNETVKRKKCVKETKNYINTCYPDIKQNLHTVYENITAYMEKQTNEHEKVILNTDKDSCQFALALIDYLGVGNSGLPNSTRFLDENLI